MKNQDVWNFKVGKGKYITNVNVHLDFDIKPSKEEIAKGMVEYIVAFEQLIRTSALPIKRKEG